MCNITKCIVVIPISTNARFASVFLLSRLAAGLGEFPSDTAALWKIKYIDVNHDNWHEKFWQLNVTIVAIKILPMLNILADIRWSSHIKSIILIDGQLVQITYRLTIVLYLRGNWCGSCSALVSCGNCFSDTYLQSNWKEKEIFITQW